MRAAGEGRVRIAAMTMTGNRLKISTRITIALISGRLEGRVSGCWVLRSYRFRPFGIVESFWTPTRIVNEPRTGLITLSTSQNFLVIGPIVPFWSFVGGFESSLSA